MHSAGEPQDGDGRPFGGIPGPQRTTAAGFGAAEWSAQPAVHPIKSFPPACEARAENIRVVTPQAWRRLPLRLRRRERPPARCHGGRGKGPLLRDSTGTARTGPSQGTHERQARLRPGFGAPGKLSSGEFSAENGRQPRAAQNQCFPATSGKLPHIQFRQTQAAGSGRDANASRTGPPRRHRKKRTSARCLRGGQVCLPVVPERRFRRLAKGRGGPKGQRTA